ncbi:MAG TPA: FAD:protein FMN transferase [Pseudomonadales bacterium]
MLLLAGCGGDDYVSLQGETMGTRYHITLQNSDTVAADVLHTLVERRLDAINRSMSTYRDDSLITAFNRAGLQQAVTVDADFLAVFAVASQVYQASGGAFNPGVGELVELWGFGRKLTLDNLQQVPAADAIREAMAHSQFAAIERDQQQLIKQAPVQLDFSAVAKGYAVDALAALLQQHGIRNYMVEIGGEVATAGNSPRGGPWHIGIESPQQLRGRTLSALKVHDSAIATSGDYRQFFEIDNKRYSHTIDPRTGWPVQHQLASVTVIADSVALADAWATALMVFGEQEALARADAAGLAVYLVYRDRHGGFVSHYNRAMQPYMDAD